MSYFGMARPIGHEAKDEQLGICGDNGIAA